MSIDGGRPVGNWNGRPLWAAALIAVIASCGAAAIQAAVSPVARDGVEQASADDPCRYLTAEAMGSAFGRPMKSSKLVDICQYKDTGTGMVVVRVKSGPEGTIFRHVKTASAQGQNGAEKVTAAIGEAYFDSILPAFVGRVGNYDVQIETTIQPTPRDAMIAVGTRIMKTVAGK
ncbi:MAG TPA: hypothetical protein VF491_03300 [Vicinamibacterales bacterium]|jgi:hypothetical protein